MGDLNAYEDRRLDLQCKQLGIRVLIRVFFFSSNEHVQTKKSAACPSVAIDFCQDKRNGVAARLLPCENPTLSACRLDQANPAIASTHACFLRSYSGCLATLTPQNNTSGCLLAFVRGIDLHILLGEGCGHLGG